MIAVIQRVSSSSVTINNEIRCSIDIGLTILLGVEDADGAEDIEWLTNKIVNLRLIKDDDAVMNTSVKDVDGDIIVVSQFTLHASTRKGNRPSYLKAAKPEIAIPIYERFIDMLKSVHSKPVYTGEFGADMKVALVNDGPVTIIIDTKNKT